MKSDVRKASPFKTLEARVRDNADPNTPYVYHADVLRAAKVAGAIGRVLLVRGDPGTGKSTLARSLAGALGWDYLEAVVTSRTQQRDLLWTFDQVDRLNDANSKDAKSSKRVGQKEKYIEPQALFHAFNPDLADELRPRRATGTKARPGAVLLIDEIDKADPDLPNDLLVPLEDQRFWVGPLEREVKAVRPVFVVVSTNEERDLPQAFMRRCIVVTLKRPVERAQLQAIARSHAHPWEGALFDAVFAAYIEAGERADADELRPPGRPSSSTRSAPARSSRSRTATTPSSRSS